MPRALLRFPVAFWILVFTALGQPPAAKKLTCASCHTEEAKTQPDTSMAHALEKPSANGALEHNPKLELQRGAYHYSVEQHGDQGTYSVTDGVNTIQVPIRWPFGRMSQTWVLDQNNHLAESLVSFYPGAHGLDTTIGDQSVEPKTLQEAVGRPLSSTESKSCFECHATGAVVDHQLNLSSLTPGLQCQRCHVDSEQHMNAISQGKLTPLPPKLTRLSAEDTSSFCGQCHRTWQTVVRNRWLGLINVRFQPYRLANSKCFDGVDQRMSCTGCHNPHRQLVTDAKGYDVKCLACHSSDAKLSAGMIASHPEVARAQLKMPVCPVAKENCTSCHMPKIDLPGAHRAFTDHEVRIVKAGESYPE